MIFFEIITLKSVDTVHFKIAAQNSPTYHLVLVKFYHSHMVSVISTAVNVYWNSYTLFSSAVLHFFVLHFLCPWLLLLVFFTSFFSSPPSSLPYCLVPLPSRSLFLLAFSKFPFTLRASFQSSSPLLSASSCLLRCTQCHCSDNYLLKCLCRHRPCLLLPSVPS